MNEFNELLYRIVGERISELRKRNNDNQQDLAGKIGIGRSSISNFESGRQPISLYLLYRIAQEYNTEVQFLLPHVNELTVKSSFELEKINETLAQEGVSDAVKSHIFDIINKNDQ